MTLNHNSLNLKELIENSDWTDKIGEKFEDSKQISTSAEEKIQLTKWKSEAYSNFLSPRSKRTVTNPYRTQEILLVSDDFIRKYKASKTDLAMRFTDMDDINDDLK